MKSTYLADVGKALWGTDWQTPMAEATGVVPRSIRRYATGERTPPDDLFAGLLGELQRRRKTLDSLIAQIESRHGIES